MGRCSGFAGLLVVFLTLAVACQPVALPAPVENITLGAVPSDLFALVWIAEARGYYAQRGLAVAIREFDTSTASTRALMAGEVDIHFTSELAHGLSLLRGEKSLIFASISKSNSIELVARRDRGISQIADLRGKRIGVSPGAQPMYFLSLFMLFNRLQPGDLTVVEMSGPLQPAAVASGQLDGCVSSDPYVQQVKEILGTNAISWNAQAGRDAYYLAVAGAETVAARPAALVKLLQALLDAESYARSDSEDARLLVAKRLGTNNYYSSLSWPKITHTLSLNQSLITNLEGVMDWAKTSGLVKTSASPNVLDAIYSGALTRVKPAGVTYIR